MKRFPPIWKWILVGLTAWLCLVLAGCIPVTIRPQFDAQGLPKATPVTLVGSQDLETGEFRPAFPVSREPPTPPKEWGPLIEQGLSVALGLLLGGGTGAVLVRRAKSALAIAARLADEQEGVALAAAKDLGDEAGEDAAERIAANKRDAAALQDQAGVRKLTQRARGRA